MSTREDLVRVAADVLAERGIHLPSASLRALLGPEAATRRHEGMRRMFRRVDDPAWLHEHQTGLCTCEVMFGLYGDGGVGTSGEMAMRWWRMDSGHRAEPHVAARLEVFGDAWSALGTFRDVVAELAELDTTDGFAGRQLSPGAFCALLTRLGFAADR